MREVVTDKGYHSGASLAAMKKLGVRSYVSVPKQPRRNWEGKAEQQAAVYANQRRVEGARGKRLLRRRGEFLERPFAHQYETGALRRVYVRGRGNVAKRVLLQAAAFNLALILRSITKAGTPKGLADLKCKLFCPLWRVLAALTQLYAATTSPPGVFSPISLLKHRPLAKLRCSSSEFSHRRKWVF
jgi:transposase